MLPRKLAKDIRVVETVNGIANISENIQQFTKNVIMLFNKNSSIVIPTGYKVHFRKCGWCICRTKELYLQVEILPDSVLTSERLVPLLKILPYLSIAAQDSTVLLSTWGNNIIYLPTICSTSLIHVVNF